MSEIIQAQTAFVGIVPREPEAPPALVIPPGFERTEVEATPGILTDLPEDEVWITIKVKPEKGILRIYHHLGQGRGREAPIVFDKLSHGLRQMSWVIRDIIEAK
jgi:hypothetical protein